MDTRKYHIEEWSGEGNVWGVWDQVRAARNNAGVGCLGMVQLYFVGDTEALLVISRRDFEHWFGKLPEGGNE